MNTKSFWLMVLAGVTAAVAYRAIGQTQVGARVIGQGVNDSRYAGDPLGVNVYTTTPAPSGHGDATQNVTGTRHSTVRANDYCPAFAPSGGAPKGDWNGLV